MNKENSNNPTEKQAKNINRQFKDAQPHFKYYRMSIKLAEKKKNTESLMVIIVGKM